MGDSEFLCAAVAKSVTVPRSRLLQVQQTARIERDLSPSLTVLNHEKVDQGIDLPSGHTLHS
jgi:hypothetical protein